MKGLSLAVLLFALSRIAPASTVYTDSVNLDNVTDTTAAVYSLDANSSGNISVDEFTSGSSCSPASQNCTILSADPSNDSGTLKESEISIGPNGTFTSVELDLSYTLNLNGIGGSTTSVGSPHKHSFDPTFSASDDLSIVIDVYKDGSSTVLDSMTEPLSGGSITGSTQTTGSVTLDLTSFLETGDGGVILADAQNHSITLKEYVTAGDVTLTADNTGYTSGEDKNVDIAYTLKPGVTADASLTVQAIPEPATYGLLGFGLIGLAALRKRVAR